VQLAFPLTTYHARVARVRETARAQGLDALVVTLPDAIHWLTGFDTIGYLWSQALVVDHADGEPVLHTRTTEQPGVEATTWLTAPKLYDIATEDPTEGLAATLRASAATPRAGSGSTCARSRSCPPSGSRSSACCPRSSGSTPRTSWPSCGS
jgi:Xaa-Pro dipeptidase